MLVAAHAGWQALDLREIDEGAWPFSDAAAQALPQRAGLSSQPCLNNCCAALRVAGSWAVNQVGCDAVAR